MEPKSQLGNYTLEARLGSGATADVFMATQVSVERSVAIKVMHSHLAHSHDFAARFQREARAMGQLQHPHIARVIDFDATGEHPYMVIEYLPGGSLREHLDEHDGPLSPAAAVSVAGQLADALQYAHAIGMVHRDIKPANVMFVDDARHHAVLTDFGIARLADEAMTATGAVLGTPAYIAPEQVRGERAEAAADQYGLGVMLYEMVTGHYPFEADSVHALMMKHISEPVPSACASNPLVSAALDEVIQRAMAKSPEDRFADVGQMRLALDQAVAGDIDTVTGSAQTAGDCRPLGRVANPTVVVAYPEASTDGGRPRGQLIAAAIASVLLVAGAVAGATQLLGGDDSTDAIAGTSEDQVQLAPNASDGTTATDAALSPATEPAEADTELAPAPSPATDRETSQVAVPSFDTKNIPALFVHNATILDGRLIVGFDRSRQPSAGTSYMAWLDGVVGPAGEIVIDQNGQARLESAMPDVALVRSFMVSEEPTGSNPSAPSGPIVLSAGLDEIAGGAITISVSALDAAERELGIAREHDLLMRNEIEAGNLDEVRRHAEHVVNIMDGAAGDTFGDLDRNGRAENPGDDIGVRGHLANVSASVADGFLGTEFAAAQTRATDQIAVAEREFLRVLAADTIGEMSLDSGTEQIEAIARSLAQARSLLHAQFAIDLVSDAPVPASDIVGTGVVWLLPSGREIVLRSGPGGFPVSADAPANPELFVQVGDGTAATRLGALDALNMLTVSITADQLAQFDELIVAVDAPDSAGSGLQVIARIAPPVEALAVAEALLATDGSLAQLNAQAQLVIDHIDLMQREINGGTLRELRRHAEHVVNLVEGASGEHFGDLDGDGVSQNPGDDIGVLAHLDGLSAAVLSLPQDTDEQAFYTAIWLDALEIVRGHAVVVVDQALRVNATDSPAEAQPFVTGAFASGVSMLDGTDADGNGVIEMFSGEFGIRSLDERAPTLVVAQMFSEG